MLDQERTSIGRLKQAFELSEQDVEKVISALWPHEIFPYTLWEMAYKSHWKDAASHNTIHHKAKALSPFPEFDPREYPLPLLHIYSDRLVTFFRELSVTIFVTDLMAGLRRVIEWTYENGDDELDKDIEYLSDGLSRMESDLNFGIHKPFTWATQITPERFYEVFCSKVSFAAPCTTSFIARIFIDTAVVDKLAAIRFLLLHGYPLRHEVKGISRALVERIEATPATQTSCTTPPLVAQEAAIEEHIQGDLAEDAPESLPEPIIIPRSLWQGKEYTAVIKAMREREDKDYVIAYVLFHFCNLRNKTEIDVLLRGHVERIMDDSTYAKHTRLLLRKAAAYRIISS